MAEHSISYEAMDHLYEIVKIVNIIGENNVHCRMSV